MPKFRVLETSFIGDKLVHPGDVVDFDGKYGSNLEPLEPIKKAKAPKAEEPAQTEDPAAVEDPAEPDLV